MRLYRIATPSTPGSKWAGTQTDARQAAKEAGGRWDTVEVPTDKTGLLAFLNFEGAVATECAAINDQLALPTPRHEAPKPSAPVASALHQSIDLDDAFDSLPLARQLHFAALAMENARTALRQA